MISWHIFHVLVRLNVHDIVSNNIFCRFLFHSHSEIWLSSTYAKYVGFSNAFHVLVHVDIQHHQQQYKSKNVVMRNCGKDMFFDYTNCG